MKAPAFRPERASQRSERVTKTPSVSPEPALDASDAIDEQIASLLESVSSSATPLRNDRNRVDAPDALRRATVPRPKPVRQALSRIAIDLPRPYVPYLPLPRPYLSFYAMRQVFSLIAIGLLSIALGFLIVYLMTP
jgi:hypothetical protein